MLPTYVHHKMCCSPTTPTLTPSTIALVFTGQSLRSVRVHAAWTLGCRNSTLLQGDDWCVMLPAPPNQRQCRREVENSTAKSKRPTRGQTAQWVFNRPNARSDSLTLSRSNQCKGKQPDWCSKERNGAATDHQQFLDHHPRNAARRCQLTFAVPLRGFLVSFASLSALRSPSSGPS